MSAIQTLNYSLFIDLGGISEVDLNYFRDISGMQLYPIMCAAAKGSEEMIRLIISNKTVNI